MTTNANDIAAPKRSGKGRNKKGNKRASNMRRHERKHRNSTRVGYEPKAGKCGSSFCNKAYGCEPWK
jgi:hypothetical protein